jgi:hypothetical protein
MSYLRYTRCKMPLGLPLRNNLRALEAAARPHDDTNFYADHLHR